MHCLPKMCSESQITQWLSSGTRRVNTGPSMMAHWQSVRSPSWASRVRIPAGVLIQSAAQKLATETLCIETAIQIWAYTFVWPIWYTGNVKRWRMRCHREYNSKFEQHLPGWSRSCQCEWILQWGPAPPLVGRGRRGDTGSGSHEFAPTQMGANWPERGPR